MRVILKPGGIALVVSAMGIMGVIAASRPTGKPVEAKAKTATTAASSGPQWDLKGTLTGADCESSYEPAQFWGVDAKAPGIKAKMSGELPRGWFDNSDWANITVQYARETQNPHSGAACLRIDYMDKRDTDGQAQLSQWVNLTPGKKYRASLWLRASVPTQAVLALRHDPNATTNVSIGTEWKKVEVVGTAEQEVNSLLLMIQRSHTTVWVDDAELSVVE